MQKKIVNIAKSNFFYHNAQIAVLANIFMLMLPYFSKISSL